jgi:prohibitin 2
MVDDFTQMIALSRPVSARRLKQPAIQIGCSLLAWLVWPLAIVLAGHRGVMTKLGKLSEAVKAVTVRFTAEELIMRRTEVRDQIAALLREKISHHGLALDEFATVNLSFSSSFSRAIEAKVGAEQQKLTADRDLLRIQVEAQQRVASARAEAEGLRLQRMEVTALLLDLRRVENDRLAIAKWDGQLPTTAVGASAQPFITLPASH